MLKTSKCPEIYNPNSEIHSKFTFKNGVTAILIGSYISDDADDVEYNKWYEKVTGPVQTFVQDEDNWSFVLQGNKQLQKTIAVLINI